VTVPFIDLGAHHRPLEDDLLQAIRQVIKHSQFILGPEVAEFERHAAEYCRVEHAVGVSSGTDALLVTLMALEVGEGDEVVTTPFSFFATAAGIARLGATPRFADIDPSTFNIDPERVEAAITPRTRAILVVHLFGQLAEMAPIVEIAARRGLPLIEDAAQAIGAEYGDGRRGGSIGVAGCLSFFPTKNLGAMGDAGMVLTNDGGLAERVRMLRAHGSRRKYHNELLGGNFRLDTLQAAILDVKLRYLDGWTRRRQQNASTYGELIRSAGLDAVVTVPHAACTKSGVPHHHIYNQYVVRLADRDGARAHLAREGVGTEVYYPAPLHLLPCFRSLGYRPGDFPEAERAAREVLALPIYPELTRPQQEHVVGAIQNYYSAVERRSSHRT
jgi:dTDP-4-amino-4,6-dideoxygalactose transaminase